MLFDEKSCKKAGEISSVVLNVIIDRIESGSSIYELCKYGDEELCRQLQDVDVKYKGISFPTSIAVNNIAGYFSPLKDGDRQIPENCTVFVELGCHVDGYPVRKGKTIVIGNVDDDTYSLLRAVEECSEKILKTLVEDGTNFKSRKQLEKTCKKYNVNLPYCSEPDYKTPGIFFYQMSRNIIDSNNDESYNGEDVHSVIIPRHHHDYDFIPQETEYICDEVYCIDILLTNGDGKLVQTDNRTTIFRRDYDKRYTLKLQASRNCLKQFSSKFPKSLRDFDNSKIRAGIKECVNHKLLIPYKTFKTKTGIIARKQFTVIIKKNKPIVV